MIPPLTQPNDAHLQRPYPADPHLELPLDTFDALQLDAFPPATPCRFTPEEEQLLRHTDRVTVADTADLVAADVAAQPCQCEAANDRLVRLSGAVAPFVVVVEAATKLC